MNQAVLLSLAFGAGLVLGLVYFGGLWLTVRHLPRARRPGLLSVASLVVRLGLTLVAFYLVMGGRWERLLVALAGFLVMRTILVRRLGPAQVGDKRG